MWARYGEVALGLWLICSPWLLAGAAGSPTVQVVAVTVGCAIVACALLSFRATTRHANLVAFGFAIVLTVVGWWYRAPGVPAHENFVITGLVLAMLTLVPTGAIRAPDAWRDRAR